MKCVGIETPDVVNHVKRENAAHKMETIYREAD